MCEVVCRKQKSTHIHTHMHTSNQADHRCDVTKATYSMPYTTIVAAALFYGVGATAAVVVVAVVVVSAADNFDVVAFLRCKNIRTLFSIGIHIKIHANEKFFSSSLKCLILLQNHSVARAYIYRHIIRECICGCAFDSKITEYTIFCTLTGCCLRF